MTVKTRSPLAWALLLTVPLAAAACGRKEEPAETAGTTPSATETLPPAATPPSTPAPAEGQVRVRDVELGRAIGADGRITDETDDFRPTDTIYASVETEGSSTGTELTARWTYQDGQVVDESTQTIAPTGPAVTEFHIAKPSARPAGKYKLEILLNGTVVETEDFDVK
jgi:hypothetical protein